mgnify:CR=1 FL=1|jgi:ABC-type phosphate transport system auxiliary subunit
MMDRQLTVIQSKIYEFRGQKVMLDFDLAEMYGMETKRLKKSVKRNIKRFPSDFMFELSKEEFESLRSQIAASNKRGGTRYMPYAFTEPGVDRVGQLENQVKELKEYIEEVFADYNDINDDTRMQMELINQTLAELQTQKKLDEKPRNPIGFRK